MAVVNSCLLSVPAGAVWDGMTHIRASGITYQALGRLAGRHATVALFDDVVQYSNAGLGECFVCLKTSIPTSFGDTLFKLCFLYP